MKRWLSAFTKRFSSFLRVVGGGLGAFFGGFGKDDLLGLLGAAFIFRGFWYWDPALSYLSVGTLALSVAVLTIVLKRGR